MAARLACKANCDGRDVIGISRRHLCRLLGDGDPAVARASIKATLARAAASAYSCGVIFCMIALTYPVNLCVFALKHANISPDKTSGDSAEDDQRGKAVAGLPCSRSA
jgi:hypothetical protein